MKCLKCNRPLLRFAVATQTRAGVVGWGPKCAAKAGVTVAAPAPRTRPRRAVAGEQPGLFDSDHLTTEIER